ncbi:MAG: ribonuclease R [Alistipes sp.]|nr:ribonuclease R [Alistipes sp.]
MARKKREQTLITNPEPQILEIMQRAPEKRFSAKALASALGYTRRQDLEIVRTTLLQMTEKQQLEKASEGRFRLHHSQRENAEGVVDMTSSGALYIIVEGMEKDVFVSAPHGGHALHGDRVRVEITHRGRGGNPEGRVVEILERNKKNYVGVIEASENFAFVRVDSRKMAYDIFIPERSLHGAKNGEKVVVRIVGWPETMKSPEGEILDVLGACGENNTEMHAILAEYDLPYSYPAEVEEVAQQISEAITPEEIAARRDMRGITTFTIDPADAKDFDDALSIQKLPNGNWEVGVHIADVTHYVHPEDIIDAEGQSRATSVYLVDRTIPMLPEHLSNGLCSLRPNEEKLCFSAVFEVDAEAKVLNEWFGRTVIYSDRRFTYQEAQEVIETQQGDLSQEILELNTLAQLLRKERFSHGSINFERDEAKFDLDEHGKPLRVYFKEMKESNQLIEEFMLLANRKVAEFIGRKRPGVQNSERTFVYRIHDKPNSDKMAQFRSFITRFGYQMTAQSDRGVAKEINRLMKKIHGKKEENIISTLAIRSMAKATYSTDNIGHYGLAFDYYTHFTSPIRRYPDMMVHRLLAHYLSGGKSEDKEFYERLCEHSSAMEVRAAEAERASIKYKMVEFMIDKLNQEFDGHISGITEWGIYVELEETKIEGMVALRDMNDDLYLFDEENYAVRGREHGRTFTLGDEVRIRVTRADLQRKQLDFEMVASYDFETKKETLV